MIIHHKHNGHGGNRYLHYTGTLVKDTTAKLTSGLSLQAGTDSPADASSVMPQAVATLLGSQS